MIRRTALVALTGTIVYDGFNDFEMFGGFGRFVRSLKIAVVVSADYMYSLYGLKEDSEEYNEVESTHKSQLRQISVKIEFLFHIQALQHVNQRSADRLLNGALENGGLYIKIGQGVAAINHILPKEYTSTLKKLEVTLLFIYAAGFGIFSNERGIFLERMSAAQGERSESNVC